MTTATQPTLDARGWFDFVSEIHEQVKKAGRIYTTGQIARRIRVKVLKQYRDQGDDEMTAERVRHGLDRVGPGGLTGMILRYVEGTLAVRTRAGVIDQRNYHNRDAFLAAIRNLNPRA